MVVERYFVVFDKVDATCRGQSVSDEGTCSRVGFGCVVAVRSSNGGIVTVVEVRKDEINPFLDLSSLQHKSEKMNVDISKYPITVIIHVQIAGEEGTNELAQLAWLVNVVETRKMIHVVEVVDKN